MTACSPRCPKYSWAPLRILNRELLDRITLRGGLKPFVRNIWPSFIKKRLALAKNRRLSWRSMPAGRSPECKNRWIAWRTVSLGCSEDR